ncbi:transglutaminase-like domain-containing protein [Aquisphaera insulae]|uniref:transglutaminase-like domain-containing protein n=1 Tax=Aquisphaera insulae TaxID=2712864 RepID=UPI0013EC5332|nr:transglutaminase family protein [Aquisphaera insulae]
MKPISLGIDDGSRYQVCEEAETIRAILHHGRPRDVLAGGHVADSAAAQAEEALGRWIALGLPFRGGRTRSFDFFQVLNFMVRAGRESGDPWYEEGPVRTFRREAAELAGTAEGTRFLVRLRREFHVPAGSPARLRVPLPLDDPSQADVVATLIAPDPAAVEAVRGPGRIEVRLPPSPAPAVVAVEVDIRLTWVARPIPFDPAGLEPWDESDPEYQLHTRSSEGWIQVTDEVARLAGTLVGGARDAWATLRAFWRFFFERMASGRIHHDELDAGDRLGSLAARGWFDCLAGSSLLAALCRARGIPARVVNGFTLYPAIPSNHYWVEVLLPPFGWIPLDLASWDLAAGLGPESAWGEHYLGRLDPRLTCQRFPRQITGPVGVRFPAAWYSLPRVRDGGLEASYFALDSGTLLQRDWIRVRREPPGAAGVIRP